MSNSRIVMALALLAMASLVERSMSAPRHTDPGRSRVTLRFDESELTLEQLEFVTTTAKALDKYAQRNSDRWDMVIHREAKSRNIRISTLKVNKGAMTLEHVSPIVVDVDGRKLLAGRR